MAEYTPDEMTVRSSYFDAASSLHGMDGEETHAEFDRFLARVRRDAAREAFDGYADALSRNRSAAVWDWPDFVGDVREWASYNYPEKENEHG